MKLAAAILRELFGLFVDDGSLAIGVLICIAVIAAVLKTGLLSPELCGGLLFVALAALLLENVWRAARK